jgi:hypothetical protein
MVADYKLKKDIEADNEPVSKYGKVKTRAKYGW